jgi:tRNA A-37 threonylcarbamoyl transferase component Bud32
VSEVHWIAGDPLVRSVVEDWLADPERPGHGARVLRDNPRRRLVRIDSKTVGTLLVKHHRLASGRHRLRERWKARLRSSPADREFRALSRLREIGVPVPPALARGTLAGGDRLIVTRFVEGETLSHALAAEPKARRQLLVSLGTVLSSLHGRGFVHGDLHGGNVLSTPRGIVLLDLQHARRARGRRAHARDLARLDHSLWAAGVPLSDRVRLRVAALSLSRPFDRHARRALARVGRATVLRFHEHARSRHRRALRAGRRFGEIDFQGHRGLRLREIEESEVAEALAAHRLALARDDERVLKNDGRSCITTIQVGRHRMVVKEVLPRGPWRRIVNLLRGSPARRAWSGGHGLAARFLGVAMPLAYLERHAFGLPGASLVMLEDLRPSLPADRCEGDPESRARAVAALGRVARDLHARGIDHGDLKASHIYLDPRAPDLDPRLIDLEGVRFSRRVSDHRRLRALAQLNASLPDAFPDSARQRAFARYAHRLPFRRGRERALRWIVAHSLAREHRWSGAGCELSDRGGRSGERR